MFVITQCPECGSRIARFEVKPSPEDFFSFPNVSLKSFLVAGTETHCVIESGGSYAFKCSNASCKWIERIPTDVFNRVLRQAVRDKIPVLEMIRSDIRALFREDELVVAAVGLKNYILPPKKFAREEVRQVFLDVFRHEVQTLRTGSRPRGGSRYYGLMGGAKISPPDPFKRDFLEIFEQCWTEATIRASSQTVS